MHIGLYVAYNAWSICGYSNYDSTTGHARYWTLEARIICIMCWRRVDYKENYKLYDMQHCMTLWVYDHKQTISMDNRYLQLASGVHGTCHYTPTSHVHPWLHPHNHKKISSEGNGRELRSRTARDQNGESGDHKGLSQDMVNSTQHSMNYMY